MKRFIVMTIIACIASKPAVAMETNEIKVEESPYSNIPKFLLEENKESNPYENIQKVYDKLGYKPINPVSAAMSSSAPIATKTSTHSPIVEPQKPGTQEKDEDWDFLNSPTTTKEEKTEPRTVAGYIKHPETINKEAFKKGAESLKKEAREQLEKGKKAVKDLSTKTAHTAKSSYDTAKRKTMQWSKEIQDKIKELQKTSHKFSIHNLSGEDLIISLNSQHFNKSNIKVPKNSAVNFNKVPDEKLRLTINQSNTVNSINQLLSWELPITGSVVIKKNEQSQFDLGVIPVIEQ